MYYSIWSSRIVWPLLELSAVQLCSYRISKLIYTCISRLVSSNRLVQALDEPNGKRAGICNPTINVVNRSSVVAKGSD